MEEMAESLNKLFALPGDYIVHCGHEEDTTLEHERRYNPIKYDV
jgi:glyoxylase-like metal-dependent hydrolase (beta-lactamase superfamily II)